MVKKVLLQPHQSGLAQGSGGLTEHLAEDQVQLLQVAQQGDHQLRLGLGFTLRNTLLPTPPCPSWPLVLPAVAALPCPC